MATAKKPADAVAGEEQVVADTAATDAAADAGEAPAEQPAAAEAPADEAQAEPEAPADAAAEAPADPAALEPEVDPDIAALNAGLIALVHPQGGTCDRYQSEERGGVTVILVPLDEVALMAEHGFVLAEG